MKELIGSLGAQHGHFLLESGHHGNLWLSLEPFFVRPKQIRHFVDGLARRVSQYSADTLCGPLSGGAFLAQMMADQLSLDFIYSLRISGPSTGTLYSTTYQIPNALRREAMGKRVVIVDDVVNAGSAVRGTYAALRDCGAEPISIAALLVLGTPASEFAAEKHLQLESIAFLPNDIWAPAECPLCAGGVPLQHMC